MFKVSEILMSLDVLSNVDQGDDVTCTTFSKIYNSVSFDPKNWK